MKILVNDIAASTGGALSILKNFYEFVKQDKENEYIFLLSDNYIEETENIKVITMPQNKSWIKRLKFDLFTGKKHIKKLNVDAIISLQNTIVFGTNIKQIVYIHQSIPFQNVKKFSLIKKQERKLAIIQYFIGHIIKKSIKKADYVIVQADWMKEAVYKKTNVSKSKIIVIKPEIDIDSNIKVNEKFDINSFFYPASNAVYKNHECIYQACKILNSKNIKDFTIDLTIENPKKHIDNINFIGYIDPKEILNKYATSVLIFPSYIETIGLPLLEARSVGTIILASDCEFSRECLRGYENVYFFDPFKPEQLAELMENILKNRIKIKLKYYKDKKNSNSWNKLLLLFGKRES